MRIIAKLYQQIENFQTLCTLRQMIFGKESDFCVEMRKRASIDLSLRPALTKYTYVSCLFTFHFAAQATQYYSMHCASYVNIFKKTGLSTVPIIADIAENSAK